MNQKFLAMKTVSQPLGGTLALDATQQRFRKVRPGVFSFLFESCCVVDTEPPHPPGKSG
jgi:hypothetical protein